MDQVVDHILPSLLVCLAGPVKLWEGASQLFPLLSAKSVFQGFRGREQKGAQGFPYRYRPALAIAYFRCLPRYHLFMLV